MSKIIEANSEILETTLSHILLCLKTRGNRKISMHDEKTGKVFKNIKARDEIKNTLEGFRLVSATWLLNDIMQEIDAFAGSNNGNISAYDIVDLLEKRYKILFTEIEKINDGILYEE